MAIVEATKRAILQELKGGEAHGYLLHKRLKKTLSTIYAHLDELEEAELVEAHRKGRQKVYRLTERGKRFLEVLRIGLVL